MKPCLIYQPLGLGDIFWLQPIVDFLIKNDYEVYYPVNDLYYNEVSKRIQKKNLIWTKEDDYFPLKEHYGKITTHQSIDGLYLPFGFADRYFQNAPIMATKYYFINFPISDWRKSVDIKRDKEKEQELIKKYDLIGEYVLVNRFFGSNPIERDIKIETNKKVHVMSYKDSVDNGFSIFDWIGAIENASEIHTVETSFCYLVDKYAKTENLNMYEKRLTNQQNDYYRNVGLVYKNSNWKYHS
jgi:hypothetical protein